MKAVGDILLKQGRINRAQLEEALREQSESGGADRLVDILVQHQHISDEDAARALAEYFALPFVTDVPGHWLDPEKVRAVPVDWVRTRGMLPVVCDGTLSVLVADPSHLTDQEDLALLLGEEPEPLVAPRNVISAAIDRCYFQKRDAARDVLEGLEESSTGREDNMRTEGTDLLRSAGEAPTSQFVNALLLEAVQQGASDIHIEPFAKNLKIRFRLDGMLYDQSAPPRSLEAGLVSRLKVMAHLDIAERRLPQDGTARVRVGDREVDIRMSTIPVAEGERVVLRLLNRDAALLPLKELGLPDHLSHPFQELLQLPNGVIWVTGPTGSGKTTTLYTALGEVDTRRLNVMTIEDPIEYQLPDIGQLAVKPKIGLTFAQGLRHILRQDPDVILVGETRDRETAEIVVRASLTGHLVFSTLHTNDAASALIRMTDMGIEPFLVASATRASLAQRLVRRLCPHCAVPDSEAATKLTLLGAPADAHPPEVYHKAVGCAHCLEGYTGRTGLFELLVMNAEMVESVRQGAGPAELLKLAAQYGMHTLRDDGLDKAGQGLTSLDEIQRVVGTTA